MRESDETRRNVQRRFRYWRSRKLMTAAVEMSAHRCLSPSPPWASVIEIFMAERLTLVAEPVEMSAHG